MPLSKTSRPGADRFSSLREDRRPLDHGRCGEHGRWLQEAERTGLRTVPGRFSIVLGTPNRPKRVREAPWRASGRAETVPFDAKWPEMARSGLKILRGWGILAQDGPERDGRSAPRGPRDAQIGREGSENGPGRVPKLVQN